MNVFLDPQLKKFQHDLLLLNLLKVQNLVLKEAYELLDNYSNDKIGPYLNEAGIGIGCEATSRLLAIKLQKSGIKAISSIYEQTNKSEKAALYGKYKVDVKKKLLRSIDLTNTLLDYFYYQNRIIGKVSRYKDEKIDLKIIQKEKERLLTENPWIGNLLSLIKSKEDKGQLDISINKEMMELLGTWPSVDDVKLSKIFSEVTLKILADSKEYKKGKNRSFAIGTNKMFLLNFNPSPDDSAFNYKQDPKNQDLSISFPRGVIDQYLDYLKREASYFTRENLNKTINDYENDLEKSRLAMSPTKVRGLDWGQYDKNLKNIFKFGYFSDHLSIISTPKIASLYFSLYDIIQSGVSITFRCFDHDDFLLKDNIDHLPFYTTTYIPRNYKIKKVGDRNFLRSDYVAVNKFGPEFNSYHSYLPTYAFNLYCSSKDEKLEDYLKNNNLDFFDLLMFNTVNYKVDQLGDSLVRNMNYKFAANIFQFDETKGKIIVSKGVKSRLSKKEMALVNFFSNNGYDFEMGKYNFDLKELEEIRGMIKFYNKDLKELISISKNLKFGYLGEDHKYESRADVLHVQSYNFINAASNSNILAGIMQIPFIKQEECEESELVRDNILFNAISSNYCLSKNAPRIDVSFSKLGAEDLKNYFSIMDKLINYMPYHPREVSLKLPIVDTEFTLKSLEHEQKLFEDFLKKLRGKDIRALNLSIPMRFEKNTSKFFDEIINGFDSLEELSLASIDSNPNGYKGKSDFPLHQFDKKDLKKLQLSLNFRNLSNDFAISVKNHKNLEEIHLENPNLDNLKQFLLQINNLPNIKKFSVIIGYEINNKDKNELETLIKTVFPNIIIFKISA